MGLTLVTTTVWNLSKQGLPLKRGHNENPILGVVALENTGIVVDPVTNSLKPLPALPLK